MPAGGRWWAAALLALLAAGCGAPQVITVRGPAQGTTYSVEVVAPPAGLDAQTLRAAMRAELDAIDAAVSTWRDDSDIARFNAAAARQWVVVSPLLAAMTGRALAVSAATDGAFDPTLGLLLRLWGFGPDAGEPRVPPATALAAALGKAGPQQLRVRRQPPALYKTQADLSLELSGLAQGYTVDCMAKRLAALGVRRYMVELGGELFAQGRNAEDQPWRVGIERPQAGAPLLTAVAALSGAGISTSGGYRDYFEAGGRRYSHTLDPRTGRPVSHDLRSVTVVSRATARADALATALLVMGPRAGPAFARANNVAALFVRGSPGAYTDIVTPAMTSYLAAPR